MPFKKISGIYRILNIKNNKSYIGSSVSVYNRISTHKHALLNNRHFNKHLQSAFNKYGLENFTFSLIEETDISIINQREEYYISLYKSNQKEFGYNKRLFCDTNIGKKLSESHIKKLKDSHVGIRRTPEANIKIVRSQYKPVYKIDENGEILKKYDSILSASIDSQVHKQSISACCRGKLNSSGGFHWCFVDNFDKSKFKKISTNRSNKRTIFVYENVKTGKTFYKLSEVAKFLGIKVTTLHNMFSGINKNKTDFIRYEID